PEFDRLSHTKVSKAEILSLFAGKLNFPTGEQYQYSNSNYFLLGLIIEEVSGQSYASYLSEHIFAPLGMRNTFYCPDEPTGTNQARGYKRGPDGKLTPTPTFFNIDTAFAAGGLCSTVEDLVRWNNAFHGHRILAASYDLMTKPGVLPDGTPTPYGFGFMLDDYFHTISHGGGIEGFSSWLWYLPDYRVTVVVLVNNDYNNAIQWVRSFEGLFTPQVLSGR
ncbi:MAG TPA: serine hydrolase domain-containing protein, partial [Acidimicrobiales bacterium]